MLINPNTLLSKAKWCKYCIHFCSLNLNSFKMVDAMGLKIISLRPPSVATPAYQISWKSTIQFKSYLGGQTGRQTDDWFKKITETLLLEE
jgi:hypothetical protein